MATAKQKIETVEKVRQLPKCVIKMGRETRPGTTPIGKLVADGYELQSEIDVLTEKLKIIKERLADTIIREYMGGAVGTCHAQYDGLVATVTLRESVEIADPDGLRVALGQRFDDLVAARVTYKPEKRLVEMACDGDDPMAPEIRAALAFKQGAPAVKFAMVG